MNTNEPIKTKNPIPSFSTHKARGERVTMITVYDYPFARLVDGTSTELILVGDSLGMVIQGLEHTNPVTLDEMIYHVKAVRRGAPNTLVVGDSGYLSPDDPDGRDYMSLITHGNGRAHVRRLCRRVPGKTQHSHGHPVFSLDDQWVLYNSKIGETHNVYMADVTSIS